MSAFKKLESACKVSVAFKSFDELEIGAYDVIQFKFMDTRFGKKVVVVCADFMVSLPERFSKAITTDEDIDELNSEKTTMIYTGRDAKRMNRINVDFQKAPIETYLHDAQDWSIPPLYASSDEMEHLLQSNMPQMLQLNMDQNIEQVPASTNMLQ